jgi:glutaredoxin 3
MKAMPKITVYTKPFCPYCSRALGLLAAKGAEVDEIEAAFDPDLRKEMLARSNGRTTYPQIFIGERHIGGCDELVALDRAGQLDPLLSA